MDGGEVLEEARAAGLAVRTEGDKLVIDGPRSAAPLARSLIEHKAQVMASLDSEDLATVVDVSDTVEACIRLGQRLKRGEIEAVRCGITTKQCHASQGVPCLGSTPWMSKGTSDTERKVAGIL